MDLIIQEGGWYISKFPKNQSLVTNYVIQLTKTFFRSVIHYRVRMYKQVFLQSF